MRGVGFLDFLGGFGLAVGLVRVGERVVKPHLQASGGFKLQKSPWQHNVHTLGHS